MIGIKEYKNIRWEASLSFSFSFGKVEFKDDAFSKDGYAHFDIIDIEMWDRIKDSKELYMESRSSDAWVYHYEVNKISINGTKVSVKFNKKTALSLKEYREKTIENLIK